MSQSLVKNYLHIVFSTKHRQPLIKPNIESELHEYLGRVCRNLECAPVIVGGYFDHVHILCMLSKKIALVNLAAELKSNSSEWIKSKDRAFDNFYWQEGYGAFSVNQEEVDLLKHYIENQHNHHSGTVFEDEYRRLLLHYQMDFDERYVWD